MSKQSNEDYKILQNLEDKNLIDLMNKTNNDILINIYFNKFINTIDTNYFLILYKYQIGKTNNKIEKINNIIFLLLFNCTVAI